MTFLQFFITVLPWALLVTILVLLYLIFLKHE